MSPILLLVIYGSLIALAGWMTGLCLRGRLGAARARRVRACWLVPYGLLSLLPVAGAFLPNGAAKYALQAAGNVWLGFFLYYGALLGVLLLGRLPVRGLARGRRARRGYGGILCAALALMGYGLVHAQRTVVTRYELEVDKPGGDMRVALLGDLHLSVNSNVGMIRKMVALVNAEQPDVVLVAGDVFTSSYGGLSHPEAYAEALRGLRAPGGVYAVYGNHDVEETLFGGFPISPISQAFRPAEMEQFFGACGFTTLTDAVVELNGGVQLAGRLDGEKAGDGTADRMSAADLLSAADRSRPILILQHEPKGFRALADAGADIALCGHTHAGQLFPGNLVIPLFNENAWGYARLYGLDTFVTAGVGYYGPPMRVGTDSEIMVIDLKFQGEDGEAR